MQCENLDNRNSQITPLDVDNDCQEELHPFIYGRNSMHTVKIHNKQLIKFSPCQVCYQL